MRKITFLMAMLAMVSSVFITGCKKDDDKNNDEKSNTATPTAVAGDYRIEVSQSLLDIADVWAVYIDANGTEQSVAIDNTEWSKEGKAALPGKLMVKLMAKYKEDAVIEGDKIDIAYMANLNYACVDADGNKVGYEGLSGSSALKQNKGLDVSVLSSYFKNSEGGRLLDSASIEIDENGAPIMK